MKHVTTFLFAAAAGLFLVQPLSAQPMAASAPQMGMGHMGMGHTGMMHEDGSAFMMLLKFADLTPAQRNQVHEILRSERAQMMSVHREFQQVHEQLAAKLLAPGAVSAADLEPLEQKAFRCQKQIGQNMVDSALAIRNLLTPEQLARLGEAHRKLENLHAQIQSLMGPGQEEGDESN